jgi:hypothetical protein
VLSKSMKDLLLDSSNASPIVINEQLETDGIAKGDRWTKNFELQFLQLVTYRDNYCLTRRS